MNPEDIGKILDELGERIGPAGTHAWEITVHQVVIDSILGLVLGVLALIISVSAAFFMWMAMSRIDDKPKGPYEDNDGEAFFTFIMTFVYGIVGLFSLFLLYGNLRSILNPEYHAMIRLLERLVPGQ